MEFKNLLLETIDGIAVLTINRPESLNALTGEVVGELECALNGLAADRSVKVVIITGAGEKAFVAGADIREMAGMDSCQAHAFARCGQRALLLIGQMNKPVIAAVNGFALGGGLELALACDFIFASEKAKLGLPEVTLGVIPGFGGTQNLARLIGPNRARELIFTGRMLTADQAHAWGIVNQVLPAEELMPRTLETARLIARNGPLAVASAKEAVASGLNMTREDGIRYEASLFGLLFASQDQKEGMAAFVEKRRAIFRGE